ncbi:general odorant-binding protein 45-like [Anopheles moucheti]|uniref:general odorant-binding protein 45-like n=1 Tax=Anopheles moucheti TaxID=186751 RepID=UPI0022F11BE1|nr:general odorant-binding protein 45-like [Anopheles moucheti]
MERDRSSNVAATAALLAFLSLASALHVAEANIFTGKSFLKAQQDCVHFLGINPLRMGQYKKHLYPGDRETMCLIRCIGITLDFWDDTKGFDANLVEQQFSPLVDTDFKKKLNDAVALKLALLDPLDNCARAFYAFRTLRALLRQQLNLGTNTTTPTGNFEPLQPTQILDIIISCAREVNVPSAFLTSFSKGNIVDCPEVRCLIRCAAVRSRLYTDQSGALLANLHRQFDPPGEDLNSFTLRQNMCLQRNQQPATVDSCTRAYKQFFACLRPDFEQYFIRNIDKVLQHPIFKSEQLLDGQSQPTVPPQQPNGLDQFGEMHGNLDLLLSSC